VATPGAIRRDYHDDTETHPTYAESTDADPTYAARGVVEHVAPTMEGQ
jgi:hypothetical protein